ncbi:hypothetical protein [Virgibacillus alimentarius]|uniref:hypothetical protein n=1 Tax=Virgibacillus alimentarius TaxID=698769 RepID=UPI000493AE64|nr:hypothetical protein [Virgibacillus alimentarius]
MINISKAFIYVIAGLLTGIIIVSTIRNGEINWGLIGVTTALSILTFLATLLIRYEIKKNSY